MRAAAELEELHRRRRRRNRLLARGAIAVTLTGLMIQAMVTFNVARAVDGPDGSLALKPGHALAAALKSQLSQGRASVTYQLPTVPTSGGVYLGLDLRRGADGSSYRAKARIYPDGTLGVGISKITAGVERSLGTVRIPGKATARPVVLKLEATVSGSSTTQVAVRAWLSGAATPNWQYSVTDAAGLTGGGVRAWAYLSSYATAPLTVAYQGLSAEQASVGKPLPAPSASQPSASTTTTATPSTSASSPSSSASASASKSSSPSSSSSSPAPVGGRPSASNTGVPAGTKLTVRNGDLVITTAGAHYDSLDIHGFVVVEAPNVKITRSIIRGGTATGNRGLVTNTDASATNFVIEDSTLLPSHPNVWLDDLKGANFTARRIDASGGVDAVKVHGNNVLVEDSYLHGTHYYASDPNQNGGPTHNDGVQVLGGSNISVLGNTIIGGDNAALQVTQDYARLTGFTFRGNWVDGGSCTLNLSNKGASALGPIAVSSNRFGTNSSRAGCAIVRTSATTVSGSGNVWDASGAAVSIRVS